MSKEAVVFVLDVGPSMWQTAVPGSEQPITLLDKAIKCTSLMQCQKIIDARKTDQVALVLTSTPDTANALHEVEGDSYSHITVAQPFDSAKYELIRYLQDKLVLGEPGQKADSVDAIVVAADLLIKLTKGKAFGTRRIIYLSNFDGEAPCETGVDQILDELCGTSINLTLVNLGGEGSAVLSFLEDRFVGPLGDDGMVLGIDEALGMLNEYGAKRVRPVATFRGTLDLGVVEEDGQPTKGLRIPVCLYPKISSTAGKLPSAKKHVSGEDQVERSMEYRRVSQSDEAGVMPTVEKVNLIKAYRYGKTLVPFTRIDEEALAYQSSRCLSILGFVPASSIQRAMYMSSVWLVEPEAGNNVASMGLAAVVQACYEKDTVALARYVRAKNNTPKLVALIPKLKPSYAGFLMVVLPYAQDLRRFTFPSLQKMPTVLKSSQGQKEVMKDWIRSMSLEDDDESLKPSTIRNPSNQRLVQCILSRVQNPTGPVPPIEQSIIEPFMAPPAHLQARSTSAFQALKSSFQLRKTEKWRHAEITRFWDTEETGSVEASTSEAAREKSVDDDGRPEPRRQVSKERPLEDFEAMVRDRHHDLVVPAFKQLMALIPLYALEDQTISLAIDCLMALKKSAIQEDEQDLYNAYLQELKRAAFAFRLKQEEIPSDASDEVSPALLLWNALENHPDQSSVTLISNAENPGSLVTPDHAQTFYS